MGMRLEDSEGGVLFDLNELGSNEVEKASKIAAIIKLLLKDTVIKMESAVSEEFDASDYNLYDRDEIDRILDSYIKHSEINDRIYSYILLLINNDTIVSSDEFTELYNLVNKVADANANLKIELDDLKSAVSGHSQSILEINSAIKKINEYIDSIKTDVSKITTIVDDVAKLKDTVGDSSKGLVKNVNTLASTVGDSTKGLVKEVADLKSSVSSGKALVASAITDKGVSTASDATFQVMADNISKISSGGGSTTPDLSQIQINTACYEESDTYKGIPSPNTWFDLISLSGKGYLFLSEVYVKFTEAAGEPDFEGSGEFRFLIDGNDSADHFFNMDSNISATFESSLKLQCTWSRTSGSSWASDNDELYAAFLGSSAILALK